MPSWLPAIARCSLHAFPANALAVITAHGCSRLLKAPSIRSDSRSNIKNHEVKQMLTDPEIKNALRIGYFTKTDKQGQLKLDDQGQAKQYLEKLDDDGLYLELIKDKASDKWTGYWRIR